MLRSQNFYNKLIKKLKSICNDFFKANFREKTSKKSTPTTSPSPFFRL